MEPTGKDTAIETFLTKVSGSDRRDTIRENNCRPPPIGCGLGANAFRDDLSRKEFTISGLCQPCQDKVFGV